MCNELLNNKEYINIQTKEILDLERVSQLPDNAMLKYRIELWSEWNFEKNNELGFDIWKITKGSHKKAYWTCPKCNSEYDSSVDGRTKSRNCPYCAGKRVNHTNSLASKFPLLIEQWDFEKNGNHTPHNISYGSDKFYWWYCKSCDISYESKVKDKTVAEGCPYCSGHRPNHTNSLASLNPELAFQWHPTLNGELTPHDITLKSNKKVWWMGTCGHEWETTPKSRNRSSITNCPYCSSRKLLVGFNDMWTTNPELANPEDGYRYMQWSSKRLNWECPSCRCTIENKKVSDINSDGLSCSLCGDGKSYSEKVLISLLKQLNVQFNSDTPFDWSNGKRYDFYIPSLNIIIETHGKQHYNGGFNTTGGRTLNEEELNDKYKHKIAMQNDINDYIVINCSESNLSFIKNNIIDSNLSKYFDLFSINWKEIELFSASSMVKMVSDYWNNGVANTNELSKLFNCARATIIEYLKRGASAGLNGYCTQEEMKKVAKSISKPIVGINKNNEIIIQYTSLKIACEELNLTYPKIKALYERKGVLNGIKWMLKDDYENKIS